MLFGLISPQIEVSHIFWRHVCRHGNFQIYVIAWKAMWVWSWAVILTNASSHGCSSAQSVSDLVFVYHSRNDIFIVDDDSLPDIRPERLSIISQNSSSDDDDLPEMSVNLSTTLFFSLVCFVKFCPYCRIIPGIPRPSQSAASLPSKSVECSPASSLYCPVCLDSLSEVCTSFVALHSLAVQSDKFSFSSRWSLPRNLWCLLPVDTFSVRRALELLWKRRRNVQLVAKT